MQNARLDEAQAGIKIARRNINNLRYVDDTTLMAESKAGKGKKIQNITSQKREKEPLQWESLVETTGTKCKNCTVIM